MKISISSICRLWRYPYIN